MIDLILIKNREKKFFLQKFIYNKFYQKRKNHNFRSKKNKIKDK